MIQSISEDIINSPDEFAKPCNEEEITSLEQQEEQVDKGLEGVETALVKVQTVIGIKIFINLRTNNLTKFYK